MSIEFCGNKILDDVIYVQNNFLSLAYKQRRKQWLFYWD